MDEAPFFLIVIDEDRKQFAVEGPLIDEEPWSRAIAAARDEGRKIRCCNLREKSRADAITIWLRHYGHFYRFVGSGKIILRSQHRNETMTHSFLLDDPEHWYRRAEEARVVAEQLDDPVAKAMMLGIAEDYERLAESARRRMEKKA